MIPEPNLPPPPFSISISNRLPDFRASAFSPLSRPTSPLQASQLTYKLCFRVNFPGNAEFSKLRYSITPQLPSRPILGRLAIFYLQGSPWFSPILHGWKGEALDKLVVVVPVAVKIRFNQRKREREQEFNRSTSRFLLLLLPSCCTIARQRLAARRGRDRRRYVFDMAGWIHNRATLATFGECSASEGIFHRTGRLPRGIYDRS